MRAPISAAQAAEFCNIGFDDRLQFRELQARVTEAFDIDALIAAARKIHTQYAPARQKSGRYTDILQPQEVYERFNALTLHVMNNFVECLAKRPQAERLPLVNTALISLLETKAAPSEMQDSAVGLFSQVLLEEDYIRLDSRTRTAATKAVLDSIEGGVIVPNIASLADQSAICTDRVFQAKKTRLLSELSHAGAGILERGKIDAHLFTVDGLALRLCNDPEIRNAAKDRTLAELRKRTHDFTSIAFLAARFDLYDEFAKSPQIEALVRSLKYYLSPKHRGGKTVAPHLLRALDVLSLLPFKREVEGALDSTTKRAIDETRECAKAAILYTASTNKGKYSQFNEVIVPSIARIYELQELIGSADFQNMIASKLNDASDSGRTTQNIRIPLNRILNIVRMVDPSNSGLDPSLRDKVTELMDCAAAQLTSLHKLATGNTSRDLTDFRQQLLAEVAVRFNDIAQICNHIFKTHSTEAVKDHSVGHTLAAVQKLKASIADKGLFCPESVSALEKLCVTESFSEMARQILGAICLVATILSETEQNSNSSNLDILCSSLERASTGALVLLTQGVFDFTATLLIRNQLHDRRANWR